ncbi:MAG: PRC-barrel domain-containing protein [Kosmotogaceae bacterium]
MKNRLKWGAKVISSDGKNLGKLTRIVVHPTKNEVTHIVIEKGFFNRVAKLAPINCIYFAAPDEVRLEVNAEEVEHLQDFEETYFVTGEGSEEGATPIYWLRPVGDYAELYPLPPLVKEYNIEEGSKAVEPGAFVISAEEKEIGRVGSVILDDSGHISHIVISVTVKGEKTEKIIPVDWIMEIKQSSLKISASQSMLEKLPEKNEG